MLNAIFTMPAIKSRGVRCYLNFSVLIVTYSIYFSKNKAKKDMDNEKAKHNLKGWIDNLSPETIKNLEITLSAAIPVTEIWETRGYDIIPLSAFSFPQKGISDGAALMLLESIGDKVNSEIKEIYYNDFPALRISIGETTKVLKYVQQLVADKLADEKPTKSNVGGTKFTDMAKRIEKSEIPTPSPIPDQYRISIKDREIWVNDYLLSKPHGAGKNFSFFEYIHQYPNQAIHRNELPDSLQKEISGRRFSKILNELGFKGEILRAFFPERGKSVIHYRPEVTKEQLEKDGIKLRLFIKQLEVAHAERENT